MNVCHEGARLQDYLDRELSPEAAREMARHVAGCARCSAELALYQRVFEALDRLPLAEPRPAVSERILARVLPSRVRRRWVVAAGLSYAGLFAALVGAAAAWFSTPGGRATVEFLTGELSRRMVQALLFAINALAFAVASLADGWGFMSMLGQRLAPFARALSSLLSHPTIETALGLAAAACVALLWWMRPRGRGPHKGARHVGVLGI